MKRLFTLISLIFLLSCICANAYGKVTVKLTVRDSFRQDYAPDSISINVYNLKDSLVHNQFRATDGFDMGNGRMAYYTGNFAFPIEEQGKYRVRISAPGFVSKEHPFEVDKKNGNLELGTFYIDKALELQAVDIVASKVKVVMKGDTLVYNATAFQLADGSMLDKLIEQLPGAKLDGNGRITVNGEFIESLLINGKDFFKGNPSVALQNLPAYTVNQVQVYRKEGDAAYLTKRTEADKKNDPLVMDVKLKKEFIGTYMANADVGYGTSKRYSARAFLSRFDNESSLALTGNLNNVGMMVSPSRYGIYDAGSRMSSMDATYRSGGLTHYHASDGNKRTISGNLSYISQTINNNSLSSSLNFMPGNLNHSSRSTISQRNTSMFLMYGGSAKLRLDKAYLGTNLTASFTRDRQRYTSESAMNLGDIFDESLRPGEEGFINRYFKARRSRGDMFYIQGKPEASIGMPYNKDNLYVYVDACYQKTKGRDWSVSNRVNTASTSILNDHTSTPSHYTHVNASATYTHEFPFGLTLMPGYDYDLKDRDSKRMLDHFLPDSIMEQVPVYTDTISLIHDYRQSFETTTSTTRHAGYMTARFYLGKVYFDIYLPYTWITDRMSDTRAASVTRHTGAFEPRATLSWKDFTARYRTLKYMPTATQVLDYTDDSDLTVIRKGNPSLHNATYHEATLEFHKYTQKRQENVRFNLYYNETRGAFSNAVTFDPATGVSTIMTKNIDGNRSFGGYAGYSRVLGKNGRLTLDANIRVSHGRSAAYASTGDGYTESVVHNTDISPSVSLRYSHPVFMLSATLAPSGYISRGSLESFVNTNAFEGKANFGGSVNLPLGFYVETGVSFNIYRGYSDPNMNRCETFWNAAVQNTFGRKKEWTVRLEGHDLLRQNSGVSRTVNAQGITEVRRNALGRFVMLHLQYRFSFSPKKK